MAIKLKEYLSVSFEEELENVTEWTEKVDNDLLTITRLATHMPDTLRGRYDLLYTLTDICNRAMRNCSIAMQMDSERNMARKALKIMDMEEDDQDE